MSSSDSQTTSEASSGRSADVAARLQNESAEPNSTLTLAITSTSFQSVVTRTSTEAALNMIAAETVVAGFAEMPKPDRLAAPNTSSMPYRLLTSSASDFRLRTSTSIPTTNAPEAAPGSLAEHQGREQALLDLVLSGATGGEASVRSPRGEEMVARELTVEAMSGAGALELATEGGIRVRVPASFLEAVDGHGVLVLSPVSDHGEKLPHTGKGQGVEGVVSIRAASMVTGNWVSVQDLDEPIQFFIPSNASDETYCAFWDEQRQSWSDKGVETLGRDAQGSLQCSSTHLTLFGAVARGFVNALLCSQATLLSTDALAALGHREWAMRTDALLLWLLLLLEGGVFLIAVVLDVRRSRQVQWTDEHFLTCNSDILQGSVSVSCSQFSRGRSAVSSQSHTVLTSGVGNGCCEGSKETIMNFIDFLGSGLHTYFSQFRNFAASACESLCEFCMAPKGQPGRAVDRLLARLLAVSIEYQACATLWMSHEDLSFIKEEQKKPAC